MTQKITREDYPEVCKDDLFYERVMKKVAMEQPMLLKNERR